MALPDQTAVQRITAGPGGAGQTIKTFNNTAPISINAGIIRSSKPSAADC